MADPFEVRMRFTNQLRGLNASVMSAQKAAQYALKYRDMGEDLHSCILEQLERNNMNTRANIMYFIEHFLEMASKDGHTDYVRMMERDIIRVVDAVAPDDGSGAANVKVVRKVLHGMQAKNYLEVETVNQIEEVLKEREAASQDLSISSPIQGEDLGDMPASQSLAPKQSVVPKLDRKQIEQRIEEDRERHKRARENIWAFQPTDDYSEADKLWDEASSLGEDDHVLGEEEWQEWQAAMRNACPHRREEADTQEAAEHSAPARKLASTRQAEANGGKAQSR